MLWNEGLLGAGEAGDRVIGMTGETSGQTGAGTLLFVDCLECHSGSGVILTDKVTLCPTLCTCSK